MHLDQRLLVQAPHLLVYIRDQPVPSSWQATALQCAQPTIRRSITREQLGTSQTVNQNSPEHNARNSPNGRPSSGTSSVHSNFSQNERVSSDARGKGRESTSPTVERKPGISSSKIKQASKAFRARVSSSLCVLSWRIGLVETDPPHLHSRYTIQRNLRLRTLLIAYPSPLYQAQLQTVLDYTRWAHRIQARKKV